MSSGIEFSKYRIDKPDPDLNFILGHSHFVKTVEDMYEVLIASGTALKFGFAFNEASDGHPGMPGRRVRWDGNDDKLIEVAKKNAFAIGAGHTFIIFLEGGFPINVLNQIKNIQEVCTIYCATANPTDVIIATVDTDKRAIIGVADGLCPNAIEDEEDQKKRRVPHLPPPSAPFCLFSATPPPDPTPPSLPHCVHNRTPRPRACAGLPPHDRLQARLGLSVRRTA